MTINEEFEALRKWFLIFLYYPGNQKIKIIKYLHSSFERTIFYGSLEDLDYMTLLILKAHKPNYIYAKNDAIVIDCVHLQTD